MTMAACSILTRFSADTLLSILDNCSTAMGSRFLKKSILFPLIDREKLEQRYDIIDKFKRSFISTTDLRKLLNDVYDLERLVGRISYENANPRDFLQLKKSLQNTAKLITTVFSMLTHLKCVRLVHHTS